jgi:hypothetical protein
MFFDSEMRIPASSNVSLICFLPLSSGRAIPQDQAAEVAQATAHPRLSFSIDLGQTKSC